MTSMTSIAIGLVFFILGFSFKLFQIKDQEVGIVLNLQKSLGTPSLLGWFKEIWFFGRTIFATAILIGLAGINWKIGLPALAVFGITAGLENLLKTIVQRQRPFLAHSQVQMAQPQEPTDPSFPSGDAMRIWFLAVLLYAAAGFSPILGLIVLLLASMVSLGRIVLGVHFPTDVLAGIGLGLIGAGATIWLWQIFNLI